jgi:hypothetical protein
VDVEGMKRRYQHTVRSAVRDAGNRMREQLVRGTAHVEWVYGHDPRAPFPPHMRLNGRHVEGWEDPILGKDPSSFPAGRAWYYPGDHPGCQCDYRLVYDRGFKSASAWQVNYSDDGRVFVARFQNRRYDPESLRLPAARTRAAAAGRPPIVVKNREQPTERQLLFYREVLSREVFAAQVQLSLAVGR